ncbi:type II toxin-antitoxin system VapC family toxin [Rhizobium sp. 32-5/1]|uniref:type II toxin-antitoxin system VapC family toxin n=1 Tax=Rhizobium sp. 32-5/1 TaxID=3019602 RepID=UPI00240D3B9E|nr:type II toxin-antitoxin system VapC family toxin [Rhizobium sp. 32-5/1]WEZ85187.1 type II toxin-antitoxin system VapC family toxin [Rhizobium sp. 32-5/1]
MKLAFILDTDVISETSKTSPHPVVVEFIRTAPNIFLPGAALLEIQKGITELCARNPIKAVRLSAWYKELTNGEIPIILPSLEIIEVCGTLSAEPSLKNLHVPRADAKDPSFGQDLYIAATALVYRAAIATFNVRDFLLINAIHPLPGIYDPKSGIWHAQMEPIDFGIEPSLADEQDGPNFLSPPPNGG